MDIKDVTPVVIIATIISFCVTFYTMYTYMTKDTPKEDIDYKMYIYSSIPALIITGGVVYYMVKCKPNRNKLTCGFYSSKNE